MRIVFMGTPAFAVPSLEALARAGHTVVMTVTQPDRPAGRGGRVETPPVKQAALSLGLAVYQPERLRRREHVETLRSLRPDAFVTAAYGQILSQRLLDIPRLGTVNVHASPLPAYRGPAPVQWALIDGERETGVTTMMTDAGVDTGDILLRRAEPILPEDTAESLLSRLSLIGAELLVETLERLERGDCPRVPQDGERALYRPMLTKEDGRIDWNHTAEAIHNRIRGVTPWPGAYAATASGNIKIITARVLPSDELTAARARHTITPGAILLSDPKRGLIVGCGGGSALDLVEIQPPSGKRMPSAAYLRGHPLTEDTLL